MAKSCNLLSCITKENCQYQVAGVKALYLINYDSDNKFTSDVDGNIETIELADNSLKAYKVDFIDNTASWTDDLAVNGNGGKYRTHTVNFTIGEYTHTVLNQSDALSMGKFTVVIVDKSDRVICLGRRNGLSATSFNYASGAADADATGWTVVMAGTEMEVGQLLKDESVVKSISDCIVVTP